MIGRIIFYCFTAISLLQFNALARISDHKITVREIDTLNERAYKQLHVNMAKSLVLLTNAEQLSIKINYLKGLAVNYLYQGEVFSQRGYNNRALTLFNQSMRLSRQNDDAYNIARAQEYISSIKRKNGDYVLADKLLNSSLSIFRKLNKPIDIVNIQLRIGVLKASQKKYNEALEIYDNAWLLAKQSNYQYGEKKTYFDRAELYADMSQKDSAIYYYNRALRIDTLTKDTYGKALSYIGLSRVYLKNNNLNEVLKYANLAQQKADSVNARPLAENAIELLLKASTMQNNLAAVTHWQEKLLQIERASNEIDRNDAVLFIEVLKQQQEKQLTIQKEISEIQKVSETKSIVLICFFIVMVIVVLLISSIGYSYRKAKAYAADLNEKNRLIEEHANSVAVLNKKIIGQNNILEEDNNLKNKLLSVISHDLRHPLTNTKSILDLVNLKLLSHEEAQHLFAQLEAQYTRAITLLDNLLYWIKSQVHGGYVEKVEINLNQMVNSLIDEQKLNLQKKQLRVINSINENIDFSGERELLKIIFRNLLSNAIKFTYQDGVIEFTSEDSDTEVKICVKDSGIGMSADTLARVNVVEGHYTSKGTADEEGSGLGLMLIRDLIKKINGNLIIESKAGEGSAFTVCLALVDEPSYQEN